MNGRTLFLIPARGGSRRVEGKNLRLVGGIPLVGRAARVGRLAAGALDGGPHRVVCSTDDATIAGLARRWGAEVLDRPAGLATDSASSQDVVLDALDRLGPVGSFDTVVLLQPTSPLTEASDVVEAVTRHRAGAGVTVVAVAHSHPSAWHHDIDGDGRLVPATTAEGGTALLTGAFYVFTPETLRQHGRFVEAGVTVGHAVAADRSIDVDEVVDLDLAEGILAARSVREFRLGDRQVGHGPVLIIAEAGVNHDGEPSVAHRLIDAAADAGADVVKFQTFDPDELAAPGAPKAVYQDASGDRAADQREMLRRLALPADAWAGLQAHAHERGLTFLSTPFDDASADLLDRLEVPGFKVGSGELTNLPFLERLARRGRPMLVSTGMADMVEVAAAVDAIRAAGDPALALFHCVSSYPAAPADANLRAIETMRRGFGVPVGWSDHTPGVETALAAVAVGASMVEKHLTLDRERIGPDHRASLEPDAFAALVAGIRRVEASLGSGIKAPVPAEQDVAAVARRSLHWARDLPASTPIDPEAIIALRPGTGMPPARRAEIIGRSTTRPVRAGVAVDPEDIGWD